MRARLRTSLTELVDLLESLPEVELSKIEALISLLEEVMERGNKVLLFGNGGSAAQAQHMASEFVNRLRKDRRPFAAIALCTDPSVMTSIANDSDFSLVFSRQIEALGQAGDVAWGFTTSGNSPNVVKALICAKQKGLHTVVFSGRGGEAVKWADIAILIPSDNVQRIQEVHLFLGHFVCEMLEDALFPRT